MTNKKIEYTTPLCEVLVIGCEQVIAASTNGAFDDYDPVDLSDKFGINML